MSSALSVRSGNSFRRGALKTDFPHSARRHGNVYSPADAGYILFGPIGREIFGSIFWLLQVCIAGSGSVHFRHLKWSTATRQRTDAVDLGSSRLLLLSTLSQMALSAQSSLLLSPWSSALSSRRCQSSDKSHGLSVHLPIDPRSSMLLTHCLGGFGATGMGWLAVHCRGYRRLDGCSRCRRTPALGTSWRL